MVIIQVSLSLTLDWIEIKKISKIQEKIYKFIELRFWIKISINLLYEFDSNFIIVRSS